MPITVNGLSLEDYIRQTTQPARRAAEARVVKHMPMLNKGCRCDDCYEAHLEATGGARL